MSDSVQGISLIPSHPDSPKFIQYSLNYTYLNPVTGKLESRVEDFDADTTGLKDLYESYQESVESPLCYNVQVYQKEIVVVKVPESNIHVLNSDFGESLGIVPVRRLDY